MRIRRKVIQVFGAVFMGKLIFSYLDPGSGSLLIQILIAGMLSLTFFFGMFWRKIKSLFGVTPKTTDDDDDLTAEVEPGNKPEDRE